MDTGDKANLAHRPDYGFGQGTQETRAMEPGAARSRSFTVGEWCRLFLLRRRYQQARDTFSEHELERLGFLRWLRDAGRLAS